VLVFGRVSATAFGGGSMSMMRREVVKRQGWLTDDEYLDLLSLGNLLPGSNPINLAVLIGSHLAGWPGATAAFFASVIPGFAVLMIIGAAALDSHQPWVQGALSGCAAVAVGMTLGNAIEMTKKRINLIEVSLMAAVAASVIVLHLSLALTLAVFIPIALVATSRSGQAKTS
jgi:chromate transporter